MCHGKEKVLELNLQPEGGDPIPDELARNPLNEGISIT